MADTFPDRLVEAIARKGTPICVGIDPMPALMPPAIVGPNGPADFDAALDAVYAFTVAVLKAVAPLIPVVKFQSAYFESFLWEGVEAYYSLIQEARDLGLLVIGDVKRGDIGATSSAYAAAHLGEADFQDPDVVHPDAITINPMLGIDSIQPFVDVARQQDKGLFVLVRTSNPGSADFQDVLLADGRSWSEAVADRIAIVAADPALVGASGYSAVGAVVGATQPHTMRSLRARMPNSFFLLPGYGAQGATADMTRAAFVNGGGAIVSASRSILYAHREARHASAKSWIDATTDAVMLMRADLARVLGLPS